MISLEGVSKRYGGGRPAVDDLSLTMATGEITVLVGPSGCGKTTTLRMINRLVEPTSGRILLDGVDATAMNAVELRRRIGYVIQQGGLFPHRRVEDNVAVVPRLLGWDKERTRHRVRELLELVGLEPASYARRYPHELSGGERQRVGVARALAAEPPVLLMDEPFGAVDPVTRQHLQDQLVDLQRALQKTIVLVTHDIDEAVKLGDRIAVLSTGAVLEQFATPDVLLARPATPFVEEFLGSDRGVRRLAVVPIRADDVVRPLEASATMTMAELAASARARAVPAPGHGDAHSDGDGRGFETGPASTVDAARWAVVLDGDSLLGWVEVDGAAPGPVDEHTLPFAATVQLGTSMRTALGELLQHDVAWLPVLDGTRYVGILTPDGVHAAMRRSSSPGPVAPDGPPPLAAPAGALGRKG